MRFGLIAYDSFGVSDFMADIIFMELFETPPDKFPINYWLNFFLLLIVGQIDWHTANLKSSSLDISRAPGPSRVMLCKIHRAEFCSNK